MAEGYINHPDVGTVTRLENELVSELAGTVVRSGNIVSLQVDFTMTGGTFSDWVNIANVSLPPKDFITVMILSDSTLANASQVRMRIRPDNGNIQIFYGGNAKFHANITYLTA